MCGNRPIIIEPIDTIQRVIRKKQNKTKPVVNTQTLPSVIISYSVASADSSKDSTQTNMAEQRKIHHSISMPKSSL